MLAAFGVVAAVGMAAEPARLVVVGGGAAGMFGAIRAASAAGSRLDVLVLEASARTLAKVAISGGGRCNVLHDETKERQVIASGYPRGEQGLLGAFSRFGPPDAAAWFRARGVELKTEPDGRMFPTTDDSATVVDALERAAADAGVRVVRRARVERIVPLDDPIGAAGRAPRYEVHYTAIQGGAAARDERVTCRSVLLATGGARGGHALLDELEQPLVPPVPSLFTLKLAPGGPTDGLEGVSVPHCRISLEPAEVAGGGGGGGGARGGGRRRRRRVIACEGPVLVTHGGISGPAVLRLSAFGARELAERRYDAAVRVSWAPSLNEEQAVDACATWRKNSAKRSVHRWSPLPLPKRLWASLVDVAEVPIPRGATWGDVSNAQLRGLARGIVGTSLRVVGRGTFKDEFVTAGGAALREVDLRTFESRRRPGLYFAGEVLAPELAARPRVVYILLLLMTHICNSHSGLLGLLGLLAPVTSCHRLQVLDIDGVTGGYNFQAAWTSGWCAGSAIADDAAG